MKEKKQRRGRKAGNLTAVVTKLKNSHSPAAKNLMTSAASGIENLAAKNFPQDPLSQNPAAQNSPLLQDAPSDGSQNLDQENVFDANLLQSFDAKDKQELLDLLNEFILQSYKIEKEFKDYKALYEWVIEIMPQAIWVFNDNNSIFYRNTQAEQIQDILQNAGNFPQELDYKKKTYLLQGNVLKDKQIITATDITAQKRQERLAAMGQISAHLAHEIRNPIGSISLLASTLLKKVDAPIKPIIFELQKSLYRVERQIKATLLFSRGLNITRQPHHLSQLQEELEHIIEQYTYTKEIFVDYEGFDFVGDFDFDLMGIVLQNFIYNAIDAIEDGECQRGSIKIWTQKENGRLYFFIKDNGKPIENKNLLFEPFATTKFKGNGLGLALSLQIVEAHGGWIALHDEAGKIFQIAIKQEAQNAEENS
ncbi:sensor histidine kinase [Helicobacter mustelae]|uniref:histidine kinase n=1 Tax=Helicobacter mustelae (strain ATCC 43772 / CCUG 25715 / CIP 103759 / LMG 18044 / NCTC 12198 / R85-136P) TaxID=679897 RepID=D3UGI6_HELM1|nr:ATP-binding protein [Helicobacter mustelae]CBG39607.1 putative signal transduction histidine kinase [Helicobacter mustelae 12198]SQH71119.1 signal transduction histidine kinase [Helicobacter mustelae]